jgi:hypothetical protein
MLRNALDEALRDYPVTDVAAVVRRAGSRTKEPAARPRPPILSIPAALGKLRRRLVAPGGRPVAVFRWAVVSTMAVVLVTVIGLRIYTVSTTHRAIEQQIESVVEAIYREPLLPGLESALLRARPAFGDYVEEMDRGVDAWLEETASRPYLN